MDPLKRKSRNAEEYNQPSEAELLRRMRRMPQPFAAYAAFLYLFGNRVTEALGGSSKFTDRKTKQVVKREYPPVMLDDFSVDDEGWIEIKHIPTLKRKVKDINKFYRDLLVYTHGPGEEPFLRILEEHLLTCAYGRPVWTCSRKTMWWYCDQYLQVPPKVLRSMRAKKLAQEYNMGAIELKEIFNWGSVDMPFHYARYNKAAIKNKMRGETNARTGNTEHGQFTS